MSTVRSKAVVLVLLIYYLMHFPLFVGVLCFSLFCYALLGCNYLEEEDRAGALLLLS